MARIKVHPVDCGEDVTKLMKSWNEIRKAATAFSKRWKDAYDEKSQAQSFLKEFFAVFGVDIVLFNTFEHRVKFGDGSQGYADCFWQGKILVEMKSRGKDLDAAFQQALDYVRALSDASHTPRAIVVSDFARVRFYDLANDCALTEFALKDLRKFVTLFGYMIGADERGLAAGIATQEKGATVKSHPLNNAFQHGVTAWRLVTRSALSNFVIVR